MIRTLQVKFIKIAMLSTFLVLFVIIGTINIVNFFQMNRSLDVRLELISENGGTFPDLRGFAPPSDEGTNDNSLTSDDSIPVPKPPVEGNDMDNEGIFNQPGINKESQFATRYFTATLAEDGDLLEVDTGHIFAVSSTDAANLADTLYVKNKVSGYISNYKYLRTTTAENQYLYVFIDCQQEVETVKNSLLASIGISLLGLLSVFLLVWFFSKKMVAPVAASYEKQKRFITDASHEIKTPLTIIDANTEVLEMMEGENEWTQSIRKQIARLSSLTDKLVFLSRMDEEDTKLSFMEFSLSDALIDTVSPYDAMARTKDKELILTIEDGISYVGDEKNIRQLLSLLLDNAMKYSPVGGTISVTLEKKSKHLHIMVYNTVDEIKVGEHPELFDRFYRRDASRNSKTGGFGIGLSVAYAIVEAHKGKITARSVDEHSIQFEVIL